MIYSYNPPSSQAKRRMLLNWLVLDRLSIIHSLVRARMMQLLSYNTAFYILLSLNAQSIGHNELISYSILSSEIQEEYLYCRSRTEQKL